MKKLLWLLLSILMPFGVQGPLHAQNRLGQVAVAAVKNEYGYQLFLPRGYGASDKQQWPLMIFLHGSGERGTDLAKVKVHGPPKIVDANPDFPFIVVSPQGFEGESWNIGRLDRLLATIRKAYRVDASRIYLTGLSMGGFATWDWAIARPGTFAAIAPVCGKSDPAKAASLTNTPIWAFHGDSDDVVDPMGSIEMVRAVRAAGGKPRLTIYPATGHDSWTQSYSDPELYYWLLQQRLP
jgi:predicted peptidase